jgi:putative FmdB family regulatory protein
MPLYEYECEACGRRFEVIQKYSDPPAEQCRTCGKGPVRRLMSSPAIQFKGSGWYITDYAQKSKGESDKGDKASASSGEKSSEAAAKADSTPSSSTASKADAPATSSPASSTAKE